MNLRGLIEKCSFGLNYDPETQEWEDEVVRIINENYLRISNMHPWLFLIKRGSITLQPTVEGSSTRTVAANANPFLVDFSSGTLPQGIAGQTLVISDDEYIINTRESATQLSITSQFAGSTTADWSLEFRRYPYPADASEVLDIVSRNDQFGRLIYMDWRSEAETFLDRTSSGRPSIYIEDEHIMLTTPESPITLASSGTAGALTTGNTYQYCYTYLYRGIESAPSSITEFTATATSIALSAMDDTRVSSNDTKKLKYVYRRDKTANGRWKKITFRTASQTTYTDSGATLDLTDDILFNEPGPLAHFRVWNTCDEEKDVEVRYTFRPRKLHSDSDTPVWPTAYHDLLYNAAMKDLASAHGMPSHSQLYAQRERAMVEEMEDRYLTRSDRQYIRRGFDRTGFRRERWGDPVKS